jgi:ribosomal protein S18 acetylase RimI-like enzyme
VEHFKKSDVIIADEASMMDTEMAAILFRACKKKHLMLVGDPNQLPSVGPGRVLGDIMDSSYASIHGLVTKLTKIFRQAEGSPVIEAANLVTEGKSPCYVRGVTFLEADNEHVPEMLEKYVVPMLKNNKYSYDEWMVLSPMKKTPYSGVNALNTFMRPFMNPYYKKPKNEKLDFLYQKGDLIIQLKNNYTADIYQSHELRLMAVLKDTGEAVGIVDLMNYSPLNNRAEFGLLIAAEHRGKGYGERALALACNYARNHIGLRQIYAYVASDNTTCLHLLHEGGFSTIGTLHQWRRRGTHYHDVVMLQCILS